MLFCGKKPKNPKKHYGDYSANFIWREIAVNLLLEVQFIAWQFSAVVLCRHTLGAEVRLFMPCEIMKWDGWKALWFFWRERTVKMRYICYCRASSLPRLPLFLKWFVPLSWVLPVAGEGSSHKSLTGFCFP